MSKKRPKILVLYASYGDGHIQVSKALQQCFREKGIHDVLLVDLLAEAHPIMNAITRFVYLKSTTFWPHLYGWTYYLTRNMKQDQPIGKYLNSFGVQNLNDLIQAERPDGIVYTFPFPVTSVVPTYMVLTDFVIHRRWIHTEIDKYFVATEDLKKTMIACGVSDSRIKVSGIPLRNAFGKPVNKKKVYEKYGINPFKKVVCIMAGAYGVSANISSMGQALLSIDHIQLIFVCGKNKLLKQSMEASFAGNPRVHVKDYVENIQELMAISSCLITKAGGITLSEALVMNVPVIVYRPLPGQEKENARYLEQNGAVGVVYKVDELVNHVKLFLEQEGDMNQRRLAIHSLQNKNAVEIVVTDIIKDIDNRILPFHENIERM